MYYSDMIVRYLIGSLWGQCHYDCSIQVLITGRSVTIYMYMLVFSERDSKSSQATRGS